MKAVEAFRKKTRKYFRKEHTDLQTKEEILEFEKAHTEIFEHANTYGGKIILTDFSGNSYEIKNPKLIMELRNHLLSLFNSKIKDLEEGIFSYAEQKYTTK